MNRVVWTLQAVEDEQPCFVNHSSSAGWAAFSSESKAARCNMGG